MAGEADERALERLALELERLDAAGAGESGATAGVGRPFAEALAADLDDLPPAPLASPGSPLALEPVAQNVRVVIRVRPPLQHELRGYLGVPFRSTTRVSGDGRTISLHDSAAADERQAQHGFTFDQVYDQHATQREVYDDTARSLVASCLEGYNATILAYGQTGTGKTYTMEGDAGSFEARGVVPRAIEQIFSHIQEKASSSNRFLVRASYLQIYNDIIYDLLSPENQNLQIREDDKSKENSRGVYVENLSEWVVRSPQEIFKLMADGAALRATGKTKLNELSSRSHAILRLIIEQSEIHFVAPDGREMPAEEFEAKLQQLGSTEASRFVRQRFRVAKLNLVDLAGSERVRISGATGQRLEESKRINRSLSALGNVISALTDLRNRSHIPYRDSKLTRILEDSLGGNCKTAMIAMVSPALDATSETLSTLKFANRAKSIRNRAFVNEDVDKNSLLRKYERELKRLRKELKHRQQSVVDQRVVLELENQKRRAEADKMAALRALESRSFEFMREKQAKRKLEERIAELEGKVLVGGHMNDKQLLETPQFRMALNEHRDRIRQEYRAKLDELEREREQIEAQRAQVDRYKQLLLKQRDIMVALTQRLNERDDQIVALQDELDDLDRRHSQSQEQLDQKTAQIIQLERINAELEQQSGSRQNARRESNLAHPVSEVASAKDTLEVGLETRVRALTTQYQTFRDEMTERLAKKDTQVRALLEELSKLRVQADNRDSAVARPVEGKDFEVEAANRELVQEMDRLRERAINHAKEQLAMRTIMEKINILALNVMSDDSLSAAVKPQMQALTSLVSASVSALAAPLK